MRTVDEVRERLIKSIELALTRPGMMGGSDVGIAEFFRSQLGLLCWIDQCEEESRRACARNPVHHSLGITGQLASQHFNWPDYGNEVASVNAQVVYALGYWRPSRLLDAADWTTLHKVLDDAFFDRDWSEAEILARFGPASFTAGGSFTLVHAYASAEENWICFDFARKLFPANCEPWLDDPCLRDVRIGTHTMTPLPFARHNEIGRETVEVDDWVSLEPRLEDHLERADVDIVPVVKVIRQELPGVRVQRIAKRHHCDLFGAWYFSWKRGGPEIRLSSLVGFAPFFVGIPQRPPQNELEGFAHSRDEAIEAVVGYLRPNRNS